MATATAPSSTRARTLPGIVGDWQPCDDSRNTLEFAPTDELGVVAMRNTYDDGRITTATVSQLESMVSAFHNGGPLSRLIAEPGNGHGNGHRRELQ